MGIWNKVTRRSALLGATGLVAASGLESSIPSMFVSPAVAQNLKPKMATEIPPEITTPDRVETRLGTLNFFDGVPDKATCEKLYDNLDLMRGVEVFLNTMAAASTHANLVGLRSVGRDNHTVLIHEDRVEETDYRHYCNSSAYHLFFVQIIGPLDQAKSDRLDKEFLRPFGIRRN